MPSKKPLTKAQLGIFLHFLAYAYIGTLLGSVAGWEVSNFLNARDRRKIEAYEKDVNDVVKELRAKGLDVIMMVQSVRFGKKNGLPKEFVKIVAGDPNQFNLDLADLQKEIRERRVEISEGTLKKMHALDLRFNSLRPVYEKVLQGRQRNPWRGAAKGAGAGSVLGASAAAIARDRRKRRMGGKVPQRRRK